MSIRDFWLRSIRSLRAPTVSAENHGATAPPAVGTSAPGTLAPSASTTGTSIPGQAAPGQTSPRESQLIVSRGKRRVYLVGILITLFPLALPFTPLAKEEFRYTTQTLISHFPAIAVISGLLYCIWRGKYLHLVENILWVTCAIFTLWWDIVGLNATYDYDYVGAGRNTLLIICCFLIALSMRGVRSWVAIGTLYTTHMVLLWTRLLREPWGDNHAYHLVDSTLSTLIILLIVSVPLYHAAMTASNSAEDAMRVEASTDRLTSLPNRRWLMDRLTTTPPKYVALLDLDDFKLINDLHGHATGDQVLKVTAKTLADSLSDCGQVGRWGGEEFLVLLDVPSLSAAADELVQAQAAVRAQPGDVDVTFSVGVSAVGPNGDIDAALSQADKLMYHIKRFGKNGVATADGSHFNDSSRTGTSVSPSQVDVSGPVEIPGPVDLPEQQRRPRHHKG